MEWVNEICASLLSTEVNLGNTVFRLLLSMMLGVMVGAERKRKGQSAGVRTVPQVYLGLKNGDPGRIAAQVITGVGFLGGGAMIHMKGSVRGLTTAAGIWMTAIIGMAVGVGMYWSAIISTILILVILVAFEAYEQHVNIGQENRAIKITVRSIVTDIKPYSQVFRDHHVRISTYFIQYDYDKSTTDLTFVVLGPSHRNYLPMFQDLRNISDTVSLTLSSQS